MRALLAQLAAPGDPASAAGVASRVLDERGDEADLAVFPEMFLGGYRLAEAGRKALTADDPPLREISAAAARSGTAIVIGFPERLEGGIANSAACFDVDGSLAGVYRKTHLFGDEADVFVEGEELLMAPLAGRMMAPLICFDIEFPEPARALAQAGAEVLVTASANMEPFYADHEIATRARALDNRLPHLYANCCGEQGPTRFCGGSRAVAADGSVVAEAEGTAEQIIVTEVGGGGAVDCRVDYLTQARGELPVRTPLTADHHGGEE